jgi:hypothetical protein
LVNYDDYYSGDLVGVLLMLRKISLLIIAIPTVCMILKDYINFELIAFLGANAPIFWAVGASLFLYTVISIFWLFAGSVIVIYLVIQYILTHVFPIG